MQKKCLGKRFFGDKPGRSIQNGFHLPDQRGGYAAVIGLIGYGSELPAIFEVECKIAFGEKVKSRNPIWFVRVRQINGGHTKSALSFIWGSGGTFFSFISRRRICGCSVGVLRRDGRHTKSALYFIWGSGGTFFSFISRRRICGCSASGGFRRCGRHKKIQFGLIKDITLVEFFLIPFVEFF